MRPHCTALRDQDELLLRQFHMDSTSFYMSLPLAASLHEDALRHHASDALARVASSDDTLAWRIAQCCHAAWLTVVTDFDGTISPHTLHPEDARIDVQAESALELLATLSHTHVAIVSGRSLASLRERVRSAHVCTLVGSHGAEWQQGAETLPSAVGAALQPVPQLSPSQATLLDRITSALEHISSGYPGSFVERKPLGAALHVRGVDAGLQHTALLAGQRTLLEAGAVRVRMGIHVVEGAVVRVSKGDAIKALREPPSSCVIYLGDDTTDEDAFAVLGPTDLGIKVGAAPTLAQARVPSMRAACEVLWAIALSRHHVLSRLQG